VKNFSVVGNAIGLTTAEQKGVRDFGLAGATIYDGAGSSKIVSDEDLRTKDYEVQQYSPETGRFTIRFIEGKENGQPVYSKPMDVKFNSNMNKNMLERLSRYNPGGKWDAQLVSLQDASYSGPLLNMKPGSKLTGVPNMDGTSSNKPLYLPGTQKRVGIELTKDAQGRPMWALTDENGIVKDEDGEQMTTNSVTMVDNWIQQLSKPQKKK
jgi:hypothetical protein